MTIIADLHVHSVYSDGKAAPGELARMAKEAGLSAFSLTDHDTADGIPEAAAAAAMAGLVFVPGIEISSYGEGEVHILGYGFDSELFRPHLEGLKEMRLERIAKIVAKLRAAGYALELSEVAARARASTGRMHIAAALVAKGYFKEFYEAYSIMREGAPFFVPHFRLSPTDAVKMLREAGGQPVLAHPGRMAMSAYEHYSFVNKLADCGLAGIESYYYAHTKSDIKHWCGIAREFGLYNTVGGDNHTADKRNFHGLELEEAAVKAIIG